MGKLNGQESSSFMSNLDGTTDAGEVCKIVQLVVFEDDHLDPTEPPEKILLGLDNAGQVWERFSDGRGGHYWKRYLSSYHDD